MSERQQTEFFCSKCINIFSVDGKFAHAICLRCGYQAGMSPAQQIKELTIEIARLESELARRDAMLARATVIQFGKKDFTRYFKQWMSVDTGEFYDSALEAFEALSEI